MKQTSAELLVVNARPWSDGKPIGGADAIAIVAGRVLAAGAARDLEPLAGPRTLRLDAAGGTVTPGLTDAHIHMLSWARSRTEVDLIGSASRAEALARVARHLAAHSGIEPLVGRGWDANLWSDSPERSGLDAVTGSRPVLLHSKDFHALWVNSAALRDAGVTRDSSDPQGGFMTRDAAGELTGVMIERAVRPFAALEARAASASTLGVLREACGALHSLGVTSVHDYQQEPEAEPALRELVRSGGLRVRVLKHLRRSVLDEAESRERSSGVGDEWFRLGALKLYADGTLGSRTASMLAPYAGGENRGLDQIPPGELRATVARALERGFSVAIHAIGDRAVRSSLDAFEAAGELMARASLMPRIEHAQLVDPLDLPRFARLGVAASMQPTHCTSDYPLAERYWGDRSAHSYPWKSLLESGARLAFGSDAPVEPPSIALGLHAAVTRQRSDGTPAGGFVAAERVTLDQALSFYTEGPARLAGLWPGHGRIAAGAVADLVVWNEDLHRMSPMQLQGATVAATVLEGEVVCGRVSRATKVSGRATTAEAARGGAR